MNFTYQQFNNAINIVSGAVAKNPTIPILEYIKVEFKDDNAVFTATDIENTIISKFEVMEEFQSFTLNAANINKIIRVMNKSEDINIEIKEDTLIIKQGKDKYQMAFLSDKDFPTSPSNDKFSHIGSYDNKLTQAIAKSTHYTGHDDLRPVMSGAAIFIEEEELKVVATDAHRLIETTLFYKSNKENLKSNNIVIPNHGLSLIIKLMKLSFDIFDSENMVAFKNDTTTLLITKVDGKYPNYNAVIPRDNPNSFKMETKVFASAIAKANVSSNSSTHTGKFIIKENIITIESTDLDFGNSSNIIIEAETIGEESIFGLNLNFAQIVIKDVVNEDVIVQFSSPGRAIIIEEETEDFKSLMLLMPVLVDL